MRLRCTIWIATMWIQDRATRCSRWSIVIIEPGMLLLARMMVARITYDLP